MKRCGPNCIALHHENRPYIENCQLESRDGAATSLKIKSKMAAGVSALHKPKLTRCMRRGKKRTKRIRRRRRRWRKRRRRSKERKEEREREKNPYCAFSYSLVHSTPPPHHLILPPLIAPDGNIEYIRARSAIMGGKSLLNIYIEFFSLFLYTHTHTHIYIYIYKYILFFVVDNIVGVALVVLSVRLLFTCKYSTSYSPPTFLYITLHIII